MKGNKIFLIGLFCYYYLNKFNLYFSEKMQFCVKAASPDSKTLKVIDENFPFSRDEIMRKFLNVMVTKERLKKNYFIHQVVKSRDSVRR